ncbi:MAG: hypothetical protein R3E66_22065 [bacterium]
MIRTKVTLVYIVLVILMGSLAVALLHMDMSAALKEDTRTALRRSANVAEQSILRTKPQVWPSPVCGSGRRCMPP